MTRTTVVFLTIDADYAGQRIDNFLLTHLKGVPKTRIYRLIRKGEVRVNKKRVEVSYRLQAEDIVRIPPIDIAPTTEPYRPSQQLRQQLQAAILLETEDLLIINKPPGIPVHAGSQTAAGVVEVLRAMMPNYKHLELAHRIDRDTSGCLVLAKKRSVLKNLHELFRQGLVTKKYQTLVCGHWPVTRQTVRLALVKNQLQGGERMVQVDENGKMAITHFEILQRYETATLLLVTLETGRSHQIRVHTAHYGHPIGCDEKYGDKSFNKWLKEREASRMFLHAADIQFTYGEQQIPVHVQAPLPEDLERILRNLEKKL